MINRLLPENFDNSYRGHKLALWVFAFIMLMKILQGGSVIFNGSFVVPSADGISLDTYPPAAAQTVLALFALIGLSRLLMSLAGVLALVRYRSAIPLLFALHALDYLGRQLILQFVPIVRTASAPGPAINLVLFGLTIVGLALSLWTRGNREPQSS